MSEKIKSYTGEVSGTISDIEIETYRDAEGYYKQRKQTWCKFEVDSIEYELESPVSSSSHQIGDKVQIKYNEDNPEEFIMEQDMKMPFILGCVFTTLGVIIELVMLVIISKQKKGDKIKF